MMSLANEIRYTKVPEGKIAAFWMGQAGFVFKNAQGDTLGIDLYLTDCVRRHDGFKRLSPALAQPQDLALDTVIASHWHLDHFDVDAMPFLIRDDTRLVAAADCRKACEDLAIADATFVQPGDVVEVKGFTIEAMPCDHSTLAPEAVGILLKVDGKKIFYAGDTCLRPDTFSDPKLHGVDLFIGPINGAFGNMNETDAVEAVGIIEPKHFIPCHYWTFAEQGGNPGIFMQQMAEKQPQVPYTIMRQGEKILIG